MIKKIIIGAGLAALVLAFVIPRVLRKEPFAESVADPVVEVTQPQVRDIRLTTGLVGEVEPEDVVYVSPKASGEVTEVNVKAGETVEEGQLLCVIAGQGAKVVSFSVTERIRNYLKEGDSIVVEKDGESYEGQIIEVSFMADSATGLFKVKARLGESLDETKLPTGSMVKLYVTSEYADSVLTVPVDSVYYEGGLAYVYTCDMEDFSLHKVEVEAGLYDSDWIEIKSGLGTEDHVLTTWSSELYEGTKVGVKGGQ